MACCDITTKLKVLFCMVVWCILSTVLPIPIYLLSNKLNLQLPLSILLFSYYKRCRAQAKSKRRITWLWPMAMLIVRSLYSMKWRPPKSFKYGRDGSIVLCTNKKCFEVDSTKMQEARKTAAWTVVRPRLRYKEHATKVFNLQLKPV